MNHSLEMHYFTDWSAFAAKFDMKELEQKGLLWRPAIILEPCIRQLSHILHV